MTGKNVSRLRHFISTRKGKVPSLVTHDSRSFVRFVALRKKIALGKKETKKKIDRRRDCRLEIIETGLIKIIKIHRVTKCYRRKFLRASPSWELFPLVLAPPSGLAFARQVFSAKKNIVKERTTIERETYVQKGGVGGKRETTRRERPWEEKGDALIV